MTLILCSLRPHGSECPSRLGVILMTMGSVDFGGF